MTAVRVLLVLVLVFPVWGSVYCEEPAGTGAEELVSPAVRLQGVLTIGARSVAVINGGFYREGDSISGFRITRVRGDRVLLEKGRKKFYLRLEGAR